MGTGRRVVVGGIASIVVAVLAAGPLAAKPGPGTLDRSFSKDGYVIRSFAEGADRFTDVAVDSQGRVVAVGQTDSKVLIARFNANGKLDRSFANGGRILTDAGANGGVDPGSVAIDGKNRIVVAAAANVNASYQDIALIRLRPGGAPDPDFGGGDGFVLQDLSGSNDGAEDLAIVGKQKIVVTGIHDSTDVMIARFRPNGQLDTGFGESPGYTVDHFSAADVQANAGTVTVDSRGRIVIAGSMIIGGNPHLAAARYLKNGELDTSFNDGDGSPGYFDRDVSAESEQLEDSALMSGDGIALSGTAAGDPQTALVLRLNKKGKPVQSFGENGIRFVSFPGSFETGAAIAVDAKDRMIVGGDHGAEAGYEGVQIFRLRTSGAFDRSWAKNGRFRRHFDRREGWGDFFNDLELAPHGRLVFVGGTDDGSILFGDRDSLVARLRR